MGNRQPNHRLVKIHRSYTVEEIADLFKLHKNTVRRWVKDGLAATDNRRPMLIIGHVLATFLQARRVKNNQTFRGTRGGGLGAGASGCEAAPG